MCSTRKEKMEQRIKTLTEDKENLIEKKRSRCQILVTHMEDFKSSCEEKLKSLTSNNEKLQKELQAMKGAYQSQIESLQKDKANKKKEELKRKEEKVFFSGKNWNPA